MTTFRTRRLDHTEFPYVYLDATYLHVCNSEDEVFWRGFLTALKRRGLAGVRAGHLRPAH